ncbi:glycosyltransferase [Clostridium sp.]|uniref:glycosyltransferase n=1 Tax=Clostridium sp. TaxID=1506 RepID=UPI003463F345
MDKGTIIYIGGFELPDKNAAAHRVLNNGKILKEIGYKVVFIDVDKELPYDYRIVNTRKEVQGFECWSLPYPKSNKQWINYLSNIDFFYEIINKYTNIKAVICYNYQSMAFMKIKRYCAKNNIKIIADCTEWYNTKGANIIFKIVKGFDSFLRMRIIQKRLDGLIVISRYLENYYVKSKNVICVPPLIDSSEKKWNIIDPSYEENKLRLVYAGSPGRNKDELNILIESLYKLKQLSNYIFYVVGITEEQYLIDYREHREIIENLNDRIKFLGRLSHQESLKYVKMADFSVIIRRNSRTTKAGFSTKFVESMTCGTPVITTKTSDLEDYVIEGKNGFFINIDDEKNTRSVLKKILEMNNKKIINMKRNCKQLKNFDYDTYIEKIKEFYDKL